MTTVRGARLLFALLAGRKVTTLSMPPPGQLLFTAVKVPLPGLRLPGATSEASW